MDQFKKAQEGISQRTRIGRPPSSRAAMTEYALVAWGAYNHMGHDIGSMASGIDSNLTNA